MSEEKQWLAVPYEDRAAAKALGAKWDWREKLWYIGPEGTRQGLAKWLPENAAAAPARANLREEFAEVLRELGGDLSGEHPIMDGHPHRMATLDDDRGEKSIFYVAHADGRPAGYAKNNRSGEETRWKSSALSMSKEQFAAIAPTKIAEREADRAALYERTAQRLSAQLETYPACLLITSICEGSASALNLVCFRPREAAWLFQPLTQTASSGASSTLTRTARSDSRVNRGKRAVFTWWDQRIQWVISRKPLPSWWPRVMPPPPR